MLEEGIGAAIAGQSPRIPPSKLTDHGRSLQAAARDIAVLAEAATIVANLDVDQTQNRLKRPH